MTSGPTQNYGDADLGRWRPHPALAAAVRVAVLVLPLALALAFGLAAAHWLPASRLGVSRWVWVACEVVLSLLVLRGATHLAKRLVPLAGLLKLTLYFPDKAPSRLAMALRRYSPDALRAKIDAPAHALRPLTQERDHADRLLEMIGAIAEHDSLTAGHSERVQAYAALVGKELGLGVQDAAKLSWAALLHDVGKLAVPAEILSKAGSPTDEEWKVLATHPGAGREIADPLADWLGPWLDAIDQHHERWDGGGYPLGLVGAQISLGARIVAVVDAYDVITTARAYKAPLSASAARAELARCAGTQFDPEVVRAMLAVGLGKLRGIAGPLSVLSAVPGLGATPLSGLTAASSAVGSVATAVVATVTGAALGLIGPGALPSDATTRTADDEIVTSRQVDTPAADPRSVAPSASPTASPAGQPTPTASATSLGAAPVASSAPPASAQTTVPAPTTAPLPVPAPAPVPRATATATQIPVPSPSGTNACTWAQNGWQPLPSTDLRGCDLSGRTLTGDFANVDLTGADLSHATLTSITLTRATLERTDLTGATVKDSTLVQVKLKQANLSSATISRSNFTNSVVEGSTFLLASVTDTSFKNTTFTQSTAALATFARDSFAGSTGSTAFLLGASVTDSRF